MLEREIHAFLDMCDDDQRAHRRGEIIVRVAFEAHVLGEVFRFHQLADVVKISADAAKRRVCADRFCRGFSKICHDQAMMIRARRFDGHAAQQWMVEVGRFQPRDVRCDSKQIL